MATEIKEALTATEAEKRRWEEETLTKVLEKTSERKKSVNHAAPYGTVQRLSAGQTVVSPTTSLPGMRGRGPILAQRPRLTSGRRAGIPWGSCAGAS